MIDKRIKKAVLFTVLTYLVSILVVALYFAFGGSWTMPGSIILSVGYMFVPMLVTIIVQKAIYKEALREPLAIRFKPNRWFVVAWLTPAVLSVATLGITLLLPGVEYSPEMEGMFDRFESVLTAEQLQKMKEEVRSLPVHPIWIAVVQGLLAGITVNAVVACGEELGWRGLLQRELGFVGFWRSSFVIGVIWGLWHAPLILQGHNYPEHRVAGVFMMTAFTVLLSPLFSYVRLKSRSVLAAAVMHGSLNATAGLAVMVVKGGSDLTVGITGLAGFVLLAVANLALWIYGRDLTEELVSMTNPADPS